MSLESHVLLGLQCELYILVWLKQGIRVTRSFLSCEKHLLWVLIVWYWGRVQAHDFDGSWNLNQNIFWRRKCQNFNVRRIRTVLAKNNQWRRALTKFKRNRSNISICFCLKKCLGSFSTSIFLDWHIVLCISNVWFIKILSSLIRWKQSSKQWHVPLSLPCFHWRLLRPPQWWSLLQAENLGGNILKSLNWAYIGFQASEFVKNSPNFEVWQWLIIEMPCQKFDVIEHLRLSRIVRRNVQDIVVSC